MHKIDNEITHKIILVLLITVTIMFQNPLEPMFEGILGKFQIFDIIFPISILFIFKNIYKNLFNRFNLSILFLVILFITSSVITSKFNIKHIIFLYLFSILLLVSSIRLSEIEIKKILDLFFNFILIMLLFCLFCFIYSLISGQSTIFTQVREGFPYLNHVVRIIGPFKPTAKFLSFYLLCLWPVLVIWHTKFNSNKKYFILISCLCMIVSLLTFGRSGLFSAFIYFTTIIYFFNKNEKIYKLILIYISFLLTFLIILTNSTIHLGINFSECTPEAISKNSTQYFGWIYNNNSKCFSFDISLYENTYIILKKIALNMWYTQPIFGNGMGSFYHEYLRLSENNLLSTNLKPLDFFYPQSQYFLLLSENGLFGFCIWFSILFFCFHKILNFSKMLKSNLGIIYILCFFSTLIDLDIQNFRFFYFLVGFILLIIHSQQVKKEN